MIQNVDALIAKMLGGDLDVSADDLSHPARHLVFLGFPGGVAGDEVAVVRDYGWMVLAKHASDHGLASHVNLLGLFVFLEISIEVAKRLQSN